MVRLILARLATGVMICGLGLTSIAGAAETGNLEQLRQRALELVNRERTEQNLEPLSQQPALNEAAQNHAADMLERNYYSHTSPEGDTVRDRYMEAGGNRWRLVAENIARCQGCESPPTTDRVEQLHQGWMNSPPHRENILKQGLDAFGFGIVAGSDGAVYAVQTFAGPGTSRDRQPDEAAGAIDRQRQNVLAVQRINKTRRQENLPPVEQAPALAEAAANLLPEQALQSPSLSPTGNLMEALPDDARTEWRSLSTVMATCGGCGTEPNAADIRSFIQQWLDDPQYRSTLLDRRFTHAGLILRADGEGRKIALLVLGQHR